MSREKWQHRISDNSRGVVQRLQSAVDRAHNANREVQGSHGLTSTDMDSHFQRQYPEGRDQEITLFDSTLHGYFRPEAQIGRVREAIRQETLDINSPKE